MLELRVAIQCTFTDHTVIRIFHSSRYLVFIYSNLNEHAVFLFQKVFLYEIEK